MRRFVAFFLLYAGLFTSLWAVDIRVTDQLSFDRLDADLKAAIADSPGQVDVFIAPGNYFYRDKHLWLKDIQAEGTIVSFHGEGARFYPAMREQATFDPYSAYYIPKEDSLTLIRRKDPIRMAGFLVWVVDRKNKICRIKVDRELPPEAVQDGYIYLTKWYRGRTYKIVKVKGRQVYFHADDLYQKRFLYNVNLDFTFSFHFPRYRLVHCGLSEPEDGALYAEATTFLCVEHTQLGGLSCEGITFIGNRFDETQPGTGLIVYDAATAPGTFSRCRFEGIHSDVFNVSGTVDFGVEDCLFITNYRFCLKAAQDCDRIRFCRNTVRESGLCGDNVHVVYCNGKDFLIQDNLISDFGYGGIYTGLFHAVEKVNRISGLVSRNEIFQTPAYFKAAPDELLMDSGAIYIATQNDDVRIEDNYVHDINGPTYNRGIFADDGASHITIRHNRIENISYYALDIDPRSARKMLRRKNRKVDYAHVGIEISDNEVQGRFRIPKSVQ